MEDREKALVLLAGKESAGRDFYDVAARALIAALGCRWAGVARLRGDGRTAETLAFWDGERRLEPCAYDLSATASHEAYQSDADNSHCFHPDRVSELFPDDPLLRGRAVSCYRGEAFFDLNGAPAGHVFALSENAETDVPADRDFLGFVTRRVGAEFNRRRTEQALQESEERMLQAIESISEGFALFDGRDRLVLCNSKFHKVLSTIADILKPGVGMEDIVRTLAERGYYADAEGRVDDWVRQRMAQHRAPGIPFEQLLSDGRHVQITAYRTADGGTALIRSDITERKRAEEALKISEVYLSKSQRIAGLAYWVWDEVNGKMSEYSDELPKILGVSPDKTPATLEGCLELIHPDDRQRYESVVLDAERHGKGYDIEYRLVWPDGEIRYLRELAQTEFDESGQLIRTVGINQDITEHKLIEKALRESETRLTKAAKMAKVGYWVWDEIEDKATYCSDEFAEISGVATGRELAALLSSTEKNIEWVHPDDRGCFDKRMRQCKAEKTGYDIEYRIVRPDGEVRHLREILEPVLDEQGRFIRSNGIVQDITDQKRAEEALREGEKRLQEAARIAKLGHWVWDEVEDKLIYCSEEFGRIHGVSPEEYLASSTSWEDELKWFHPEDRERCSDVVIEAVRQAQPFDIEYRIVRRDGEIRHIHERAEPIVCQDGTVTRTLGTIQDVTEQRQAEETLRTREAWLTAILDSSPVEIALKDSEGRIFLCNKKFLDGFGVTLDQVRGKRSSDFLPHDIAKIYEDADRQVLESGEFLQQEVTETRDGETHHYLNSKFPLKDKTEGIVGVCSITTEITHLKEMQDQLRQAQKMEAVGQLTGGMAHEFNNLLAVILGNAELLSHQLGEHNGRVDAVIRAATRGAKLTQQLLAFSRKQRLIPQVVDLNASMADMTDILRRTLGETIEMDTSLAEDLWRTRVDPHQLENTLLNLAVNARDAMPKGGTLTIASANVRLTAAAAAALGGLAPGDYVRLSVSDSGTGMAPEVIERAFEPFFTTKDIGKGTGLGLSMVYGFVKQSVGHVTIYSEPGHGTTVHVYLPRSPDGAAEAIAKGDVVEIERGSARILVVEDDPDVRKIPARILRNQGYEVVEAGNGKEAIDHLKVGPTFNLLFTDVALPGGMSGVAIAIAAKRLQPDIKVLYTSGHAKHAEFHHGKLVPGETLVKKPYRRAELLEKVRATLDSEDD